MKKSLLVFSTLFVLILGACGTHIPAHMVLNENSPGIVPNNSKATLVVTREQTSVMAYGSGADVNVFLDDDFIGQTTWYSYFVKLVDPGRHYVFSYAIAPMQAAPISTVRFDFKAGKTYYLRHSVRTPPMAFTTFTTTEAIAPGDINFADLKYLKFNSLPGSVLIPDADKKAAIRDFDNNPEKFSDILNYKGY